PGRELLAARRLTRWHPGAREPALSEVDCSVRENELLAVLGPNGAGKSTLALALGGLIAPSAGAVVAATVVAGGAGRDPYRALAVSPRVLILDEPTFGQDRRTWLELVDLLAGLRDAGRAIVAATHDQTFVDVLADRTFPLSLREPTPVTA